MPQVTIFDVCIRFSEILAKNHREALFFELIIRIFKEFISNYLYLSIILNFRNPYKSLCIS